MLSGYAVWHDFLPEAHITLASLPPGSSSSSRSLGVLLLDDNQIPTGSSLLCLPFFVSLLAFLPSQGKNKNKPDGTVNCSLSVGCAHASGHLTWGRAAAGWHPPGWGEDTADDIGGEESDISLHLKQVEHQGQEHAHRKQHGPADHQVGGPVVQSTRKLSP